MPKGEGHGKSKGCMCPDCNAMDEFRIAAQDEVFNGIMQATWAPIELESVVSSETSRFEDGSTPEEMTFAGDVTTWAARIGDNEPVRQWWVDNKTPPGQP